MGPLWGFHRPWTACPHWLGLYTFAIKAPPDAALAGGGGGTVKDGWVHFDTTASPLYSFYYYPVHQWYPLCRPPPFFFSAFYYRDEHNLRRKITRAELIAAFTTLVHNWADCCMTSVNISETIDLARRGDSVCVRANAALFAAAELHKSHIYDLVDQHLFAAILFSRYLDLLSRVERYGLNLDNPWDRYLGRLNPFMHAALRDPRVTDDSMDDYVFRAAAIVNDRPGRQPQALDPHTTAVDLIERLLNLRRLPLRDWQAYHPNLRRPADCYRRENQDVAHFRVVSRFRVAAMRARAKVMRLRHKLGAALIALVPPDPVDESDEPESPMPFRVRPPTPAPPPRCTGDSDRSSCECIVTPDGTE